MEPKTDEYDERNIRMTDFGYALFLRQQPNRHDLLWCKQPEGRVFRFGGPGWYSMNGRQKFIPGKTT